MKAAKASRGTERVVAAVRAWRELTPKQRRGLTDYLIDDTKEQREAASECGETTDAEEHRAWARTNVVALVLLRAVAGWKP